VLSNRSHDQRTAVTWALMLGILHYTLWLGVILTIELWP
jgi:hypothetical protein